jgi:2'-5' RNA ligase
MMLRSFIAVEIPADIQSAIARSTAALQESLPKPLVRWVPAQNVHLTIKFLGDVSPVNLERLTEAVKLEVAKHEPFSIPVGGLGAFPSPRQARVIWIGLEVPLQLSGLLHGVEAVTAKFGYAAEDRPFSPHLTIGRVGRTVDAAGFLRIRSGLEEKVLGALGSIRVEALHMFKSDLKPGGSVYTLLRTLPMKSVLEN